MRPEWDEYFMEMAYLAARRSTCVRRHVGAVIIKDKRVMATGYNGAPTRTAHCNHARCLRERLKIPSGSRQEICRGLHAEQNAIIQAARYGINISGSVLYCTHQPCITCAKMLINAGIGKVIFTGDYPDEFSRKILAEGRIKLQKIKRR